ncbi:MAG TPA: DUF456 family protein [Longimicrobiaceae bacterium]|nr:DUF456 family protein [Longimicrobiaceae bacterium]
MPSVAYVVLGLAQMAGLLLLPVWPAGIWLQLGSLALYGWWSGFDPVGWIPLLILLAAAVLAEAVEPPLAGGKIDAATRRRGGTGGLVGGGCGALAGYTYPLLGSLFGALLGAVLGAGAAILSRLSARPGLFSSTGQAVALAVRSTTAIGIATFAFYSLRP